MKALLNKPAAGRPSLCCLLLVLHCPCLVAICVAQALPKPQPMHPAILKRTDQIPAQIEQNSVCIYNNIPKLLTITVLNNSKPQYKEALAKYEKSYVPVSQKGVGAVVFLLEVPGQQFKCALQKGKFYQAYLTTQGKLTAAKVAGP